MEEEREEGSDLSLDAAPTAQSLVYGLQSALLLAGQALSTVSASFEAASMFTSYPGSNYDNEANND